MNRVPFGAKRAENGRSEPLSWIRSGAMQGLLAATLVLVVGCTFTPPEPASSGDLPGPDAGGPDAGAPAPDGATGDAPPAARCSTYNYEYGGHRYRLTMQGQSVRSVAWATAKIDCESDGGYLLKIDTSGEDRQVENVLGLGPPEVWIGLYDADQQGNYRWTDGTPPAFTRWSSAPSAASPDCVMKITSPFNGRWYTRDCAGTRPAVCECDP
jgi:hypothetical protein